MAITMLGIQTLLEAAATAVSDGDWATARSKLIQAEIQFEGLPADAGLASARTRFDRRSRELLAAIDEIEGRTERDSDTRRLVTARTRHSR